MSRLIFLLICYNLLSLNLGREYEPPGSAQYPFGDEDFNADIKEERVQDQSRQFSIEFIKDIYLFCPNITEDEDKRDGEIPDNDNLCEKCDVRPTFDKIGVLVECYNCTETSGALTVSQQEHAASDDHILFLATFLEIANYSAPEDIL